MKLKHPYLTLLGLTSLAIATPLFAESDNPNCDDAADPQDFCENDKDTD